MRKPTTEPVTLGYLNIDRGQDTSSEKYQRIVGAVEAAQRLGQRVDVRITHSDRDGRLAFLEFVATPSDEVKP